MARITLWLKIIMALRIITDSKKNVLLKNIQPFIDYISLKYIDVTFVKILL